MRITFSIGAMQKFRAAGQGQAGRAGETDPDPARLTFEIRVRQDGFQDLDQVNRFKGLPGVDAAKAGKRQDVTHQPVKAHDVGVDLPEHFLQPVGADLQKADGGL